jgi:heat shock protein HslJ
MTGTPGAAAASDRLREEAAMRIVLVFVLGLLLAACGGEGGVALGPEPGQAGGGPDGEWVLAEGQGVTQVDGYPITLRVADGQVGGTAACNSYGGDVEISGGDFRVGDIPRTEMGCPEPGVHEAESAYLEQLARVERWERDGERLLLLGADARLVFDPVPPEEPAALEGTRWEVESFVHGSGPDGTVSSVPLPAWLQLAEDGTFSAHTGCNDITGIWSSDGAALSMELQERTDAFCEQEADLLAVLEGEPSLTLDGRTLTLTAGERGLHLRAAE